MAGGDEFTSIGAITGVGAALLFIGAGTNVYDAFSAVMSSPWSTEKFTNSPEEEKKGRKYVRHAIIISWIYAGVGTMLAYKSAGWKLAVWPLFGALIVTIYMYALYNNAIKQSPQGQKSSGFGILRGF